MRGDGLKPLDCAQFVPLFALRLVVFPAQLGSPILAISESHRSCQALHEVSAVGIESHDFKRLGVYAPGVPYVYIF